MCKGEAFHVDIHLRDRAADYRPDYHYPSKLTIQCAALEFSTPDSICRFVTAVPLSHPKAEIEFRSGDRQYR